MPLTKRKKKTNIRQECVNKSLPAMYLENLLIRFRQAIQVNEQVLIGYKTRGETLVIISNRPGLLIGKQGKNIDLLLEMLQNDEACLRHLTKVEFTECGGVIPDTPWTKEEIEENIKCARWDYLDDLL